MQPDCTVLPPQLCPKCGRQMVDVTRADDARRRWCCVMPLCSAAAQQGAMGLNVALATALGVATDGLTELTLRLRGGKAPELEARYLVRSANGLSAVVSTYDLAPRAHVEQIQGGARDAA
jgi:hypothetical protein